MLKDLGPREFSNSAIIVANILTELFDDNDIFALGNWLMLLGQYLQTYSAQLDLLNTINTKKKDQS